MSRRFSVSPFHVRTSPTAPITICTVTVTSYIASPIAIAITFGILLLDINTAQKAHPLCIARLTELGACPNFHQLPDDGDRRSAGRGPVALELHASYDAQTIETFLPSSP